jgi:hypothetical protein
MSYYYERGRRQPPGTRCGSRASWRSTCSRDRFMMCSTRISKKKRVSIRLFSFSSRSTSNQIAVAGVVVEGPEGPPPPGSPSRSRGPPRALGWAPSWGACRAPSPTPTRSSGRACLSKEPLPPALTRGCDSA